MVKSGELMMEQCGTPAYIAPEILKDKGYQGFTADIWSTGVVLYAMIYGTVPFRAGDMDELHRLVMNGSYVLKEEVSEEARDLLKRILEVNPKKRYTIPQILCHKWFADYDSNISLFTNEEKENIAKDFTYARRENRNQAVETIESDWFIEQDIDKTQHQLTRNVTSKSVILAPFNSSVEDDNELEVALYSKKAIKLNSKVKEIDRQYERNNNCEVDNGVYNKMSFSAKESDINPLHDKEVYEDSNKNKETNVSASQSIAMQEPLLKCLAPKTLVIDKELVRKISELGYPYDFVMDSLNKLIRNYATTTYYLLASQQYT